MLQLGLYDKAFTDHMDTLTLYADSDQTTNWSVKLTDMNMSPTLNDESFGIAPYNFTLEENTTAFFQLGFSGLGLPSSLYNLFLSHMTDLLPDSADWSCGYYTGGNCYSPNSCSTYADGGAMTPALANYTFTLYFSNSVGSITFPFAALMRKSNDGC